MHFGITTTESKRIRAEGIIQRTPIISVKYLHSTLYRYTAVVSKRQGNAVERNRIKRIIREIMRTKEKIYPHGLYLIYFNKNCKEFNRNHAIKNLDDIINIISTKYSS